MSDQNQDTRKPEEIESDIKERRERLDRTLHELEDKVSPHRLLDTTLEYVRGGGANEFASNLSDTIKRNPAPFLLTSVGLGWLILSQRGGNNHGYHHDADIYGYDDGYHYPMTTRTAPTSRPGNEATRMPPSASATAPDGVPSQAGTTATATRIPPAAHAATPIGEDDHHDHQGGSRMSGAKAKAQHMSDSARERAQGVSNSVQDGAQHMSSGMRDGTARMKRGTRNAAHDASQRAQSAGQQATQFVQDYPLVTAALGIAVGAAVGSLLPSTRTEDERLGGMRDKAMDRAAEEGEHYAEQARARVHEKAEQKEKEAPSSSGTSSDTAGSTGTSTSASNRASSASDDSGSSGSTGTGNVAGAAGTSDPASTRNPASTATPAPAPSRQADRDT